MRRPTHAHPQGCHFEWPSVTFSDLAKYAVKHPRPTGWLQRDWRCLQHEDTLLTCARALKNQAFFIALCIIALARTLLKQDVCPSVCYTPELC